MSAVLTSPSLPTMLNLEDLKAYIASEIKKGIEQASYVSIEQYNELKASHIDSLELLANAMMRITQLEETLFLHDSEGELVRDDYDKPIISPQIESEVIEDAEKETFIPSGKYEKGAVELIKHAATMKPFNGGKFINNSMFHHFRQNILPDELKPTEKGAREWKKEVIKIVKRIAPEAWTDNKKDGNRGKRLGFPRDFSINRLNVILT